MAEEIGGGVLPRNHTEQRPSDLPEHNPRGLGNGFSGSFGAIPFAHSRYELPKAPKPAADVDVQEAISKHMSHSKTSEKLLNWQNIVNSQRAKRDERRDSQDLSHDASR